DESSPKEEKPLDWVVTDLPYGTTPAHPARDISWYDAVLFCNWLSRKEGRIPCYERTGKKEIVQRGDSTKREYDAWGLVADATGYRLPTQDEWTYCCLAGVARDLVITTDKGILRKYAVFESSRTAFVGSKMPNGWGLFDTLGNVNAWCWDEKKNNVL